MIKTTKPINNVDDITLPPDPERVVEGLRDTGYNFNTALADIIDNSIAADATRIDINVSLNSRGEVSVYVVDNGSGMNEEGLKNAMRYGSKAREDPRSLGKFGLGLKTGSTAFCRCLSVVSRGQGNDEVRKVQWDLDYIARTNGWNLRQPSPTKDEINILDATAEGGSGTLVIWEKIDRLLKMYKNRGSQRTAFRRTVDDLFFHISMVYQRFLDPRDTRARNIIITLNGTAVSAWDPFCLKERDTECLADETVDVELPDEKESSFIVKAYLLPNSKNFSTSKAREDARISNDMQGFYIYRENRLIHYGDWMGMFSREPHGSLLRVEFSFDYTLDDVFNVDIKKSRILLNEEIFDYLKDQILPAPRRAADERYRTGVKKHIVEHAYDAHEASNKNIDEKAVAVEDSKVTITGKDQVKLENRNGVFTHKITIRSSSKAGQYRVIPVDSLDDGQLWNPCIVDGGKHAVELNQSHPYYQKIYFPILQQNVMVTGMDALLWALAEAELSTFNAETKEQYEDMRIQVSRYLKKLIADLPDPEPEDGEE